MPLISNAAMTRGKLEYLVVIRVRVFVVRMSLQLTEQATECHVFLDVQVLVGKEQYFMLFQQGEDSLPQRRVCSVKRQPSHLCAQGSGQTGHVDTFHGLAQRHVDTPCRRLGYRAWCLIAAEETNLTNGPILNRNGSCQFL